ncbi:methionine aminopeptidase MAP1 [Ascoidea rubescens DSM 1968]|uniref:Methionine aminopeptidase n=1 Tax=Ascoidea rubescens DSM 1968 TaxID=1344418 RepID=A0A1D2VDA3_9ASCO|nr:putative methionine aminopeptidase precursor [Ascoidea rubescens DSM 1968]ODV59562.1 putative methionine aminopeptidase precursor [Ascoidea rubescens DSM 1968]
MSASDQKIYCCGPNCGKETTSSLKCPICLKQNLTSVFCDQSCFRRNWLNHKAIHVKNGVDSYNPFPDYEFTGALRPFYPLSPRRFVPDSIKKPEYVTNGIPVSEQQTDRTSKMHILSESEIKTFRTVNKLGREVLDAAAAAIKPGITTDEIDEIVHNETIKRKAYPSPLNYYNFPKSVCTSVNEVICHGIPDKRPLKDGDIVNLDISLYKDGFHSDLNETYYVGDKAKSDPKIVNLIESTRECLDLAIQSIKPGFPIRNIGNIIEPYAKKHGLQVVRTYSGHGVGTLFHCKPDIFHYAKNKAAGVCKPGMTFTIEPMITQGTWKDDIWPDNWTAVTQDGGLTAQFEHTLLVTQTGVEVLTARFKHSPGGPVKRL